MRENDQIDRFFFRKARNAISWGLLNVGVTQAADAFANYYGSNSWGDGFVRGLELPIVAFVGLKGLNNLLWMTVAWVEGTKERRERR